MRLPWFGRNDRNLLLRFIGAGVVALVLAAIAFVGFGGVDVAADHPHSWLTYTALHTVFGRSVALRASSILPPKDLDDPTRVKLGAQQYHLVCSNCHGAPGLGQSQISLSMTPRPQHLPTVIHQFSDSELFWIVKHGVKFSAMPSWVNQTRDDEVWSMVAFLKQLPTMSAETYLGLVAAPQPSAAPTPLKAPAALRDADSIRNTVPRDEHLYAAPAIAFGDRSIASDPLAVCSRCHGADGLGGATGGEAPNLTIQSAAYLRAALEAYSSGSRKSGFMQPLAAELSEEQIAALANHFGGLAHAPASAEAPASALAEAGRKLAIAGIPSRAIPGCASCHESAAGERLGAPHLAGQSAIYLTRQLVAMRNGDRGATVAWNPMPAIARTLSDADIAEISAFYAGEKPATPADTDATLSALTDGADPHKGEVLFKERCITCHGVDARGDPLGEIPNQTVQTEPYLVQALRAYRAGRRTNVKMRFVAGDLSDQTMASLAAYIGSLPQKESGPRPDPAAVTRGEKIAKEGFRDRGVPACVSCHEPGLTAQLPLVARLDGQNMLYLQRKLDYFAGPEGKQLDALNPMPAIAGRLTSAEQADAAAWFASRPPLPRPEGAR